MKSLTNWIIVGIIATGLGCASKETDENEQVEEFASTADVSSDSGSQKDTKNTPNGYSKEARPSDGQKDGQPTTAIIECKGVPLSPRAIAGNFKSRQVPADLEAYWPTDAWRSAEPVELGLDPEKLDIAMQNAPPGSNTLAKLVIRHGYIVAEMYSGIQQDTRCTSASMAKSFSSTLIGILIDQGLLNGTDEKLCNFYEEWSCDSSDPHSEISVDNALNVATGLEWVEDWSGDSDAVNDIVLAGRNGLNLLDHTLTKPVAETPGTRIRYSTGDPALLSGVIQELTGKSALDFAREVLFGPIGIPGVVWESDSKGRTTTYAGIEATAREYAKFGYLFLREGKWDDKQIVSADWVSRTTHGDDPCQDWYRYLWHQNLPYRFGKKPEGCTSLANCSPIEFANIPPDIFMAEGVFGQTITIIPSADMVVVRLGQDQGSSQDWDKYQIEFLTLVLDSVEDI